MFTVIFSIKLTSHCLKVLFSLNKLKHLMPHNFFLYLNFWIQNEWRNQFQLFVFTIISAGSFVWTWVYFHAIFFCVPMRVTRMFYIHLRCWNNYNFAVDYKSNCKEFQSSQNSSGKKNKSKSELIFSLHQCCAYKQQQQQHRGNLLHVFQKIQKKCLLAWV